MSPSLPDRMIKFAVKHAGLVILATFAATLVLGWFALKVRIYPDFVSLLPKNAEVNKILKEYGGEGASVDTVVLAVTADASGGDVFTPARLSAFSDAVSAIAAIHGVESAISPFNLVAFAREGGQSGDAADERGRPGAHCRRAGRLPRAPALHTLRRKPRRLDGLHHAHRLLPRGSRGGAPGHDARRGFRDRGPPRPRPHSLRYGHHTRQLADGVLPHA